MKNGVRIPTLRAHYHEWMQGRSYVCLSGVAILPLIPYFPHYFVACGPSAHLPSINSGSRKNSLLTQFDLNRRCVSIYKKVPVVTFFVMESTRILFYSYLKVWFEQVCHLVVKWMAVIVSTDQIPFRTKDPQCMNEILMII